MNKKRVCLTCMILLLFLLSLIYPNIISFYLILICSSMLIFKNIHKHKKFLTLIFLGSMLFKLTILFALNFYITENTSTIFPDSHSHWVGYQIMSERLTNFKIAGENWETDHVVYSVLISLFGKNLSVLEVFNIFLTSLTGIVIFFLTLNTFNNEAAKSAAILFSFIPSLSTISTQLLKDPIIIFLSSSVFLVLSSKTTFLKKFTLLLSSIILISYSRYYIAALLTLSIALHQIINFDKISKFFTLKKTRVIGLLMIILFVLSPSLITENKLFGNLTRIYHTIITPTGITNVRTQETEHASTAFEPINFNSKIAILQNTPKVLVNFFLRPFFWNWNNNFITLLSTEMLLWYVLLPFTAYGISHSIRNFFKKTAHIIFFIVSLTLVYSFLAGNLGNLMRWRLQIYIYLLMFASVGLVHFYKKIKRKKWF